MSVLVLCCGLLVSVALGFIFFLFEFAVFSTVTRSSTENRERESTILNSNFRVIEGESEHKEGRF